MFWHSVRRTLAVVVSACFAAAVLAAPAPAPVAGAGAARAPFLVPVRAQATGFGPFVEQLGRNGARPLVRAFGQPSRVELGAGGTSCTMRWMRLGVRAQLTNFGRAFSPCLRGYFFAARLTDHRWHTAAGVRPGSSESTARKLSRRRCTRQRCGITGYALGLHHSDCAGRLVPSVIAEVRDRRVAALRVLSHGCE